MRTAEICRTTKETDIRLKLNLDSSFPVHVSTGIGFFDHMLTAFATHCGISMELTAKGDLQVDAHHTVEDVGIVLGKAFAQVLQDKTAIARYGSFFVPMDESLGFAAVDICGRPYLVFSVCYEGSKTGEYENQLTEEFFRAFAYNGLITLHIKCEYGNNDHHKNEAIFKAAAHAIRQAIAPRDANTVLSTKGVLES